MLAFFYCAGRRRLTGNAAVTSSKSRRPWVSRLPFVVSVASTCGVEGPRRFGPESLNSVTLVTRGEFRILRAER
jgi:hypothetical protein